MQTYRIYKTIKYPLLPYPKKVYQWNNKIGWDWINKLQKLCFWFLDKIEAYHVEEHNMNIPQEVWYREERTNHGLLMNLIHEHNMIKEIYHSRFNYELIVGPDVEKELWQKFHEGYVTPLIMTTNIKLNGDDGPKFFDIPITVVPWMDGAIFIPRRKS